MSKHTPGPWIVEADKQVAMMVADWFIRIATGGQS